MASLGVGHPPLCTYSSYYNNEASEAFGENYGRMMGEYTLNGAAVLSAAKINTMVNSCATQRIPTAFLMLGI